VIEIDDLRFIERDATIGCRGWPLMDNFLRARHSPTIDGQRQRAFNVSEEPWGTTRSHTSAIRALPYGPGTIAGYRMLTVVASLMFFDELPIISFTGSASTLN
jgi:hypothetical protein